MPPEFPPGRARFPAPPVAPPVARPREADRTMIAPGPKVPGQGGANGPRRKPRTSPDGHSCAAK
nr:hypothetical protein KPHV_30170 [Kitasatospora purpeofusca]